MKPHRLATMTLTLLLALGACGDDSGTATLPPPPTDTDPVAPADPAGEPAGEPAADEPAKTMGTALGSAVPGDPMKVRIHTLDNGLTVMLSENREAPRIHAMITTRTGSAKDPATNTGLAHYLEHMLFKGTTRIGTRDWEKEKPHLDEITRLYDERFKTTDPAKRDELYEQIDEQNKLASQYEVPNEFDRLYDAFGFQSLNAFTSNDQTSYVVDLPANRLAHWAEVEAERFTSPVFRLFQTELEAVYEEKNRGMDNKDRVVWEEFAKALFPEHPYGTQSTLGTVEHLKNPAISAMYEYFYKWYVPGNMVVALSGDFDSDEALKLVDEHLGKLEWKPIPPDPEFPIAPPTGVKRVEIEFKAEEQVTVGWVTVSDTHPDRDALMLADMMLDNQKTGLVNVNLMQAQRVRNAGSAHHFMLEGGYQQLYAVPKPGQTLEECEALLHEQVAKLKAGEFTQDDLTAVITDFEVMQKRQREDNQSRTRMMTDAFIKQVPWKHKVEELDRLRKITKQQVVAAANKYFGDGYVVLTRKKGTPELPKIPKPSFTPVEIDGDQHSAYFEEMKSREVEPIAPRFAVRGEDYVVKEYPWGRLYWTRNPANDLFDINFIFEIGTDHDDNLSMAMPLLDLAGAGDLDPVAYKRRLYALGTTAGAGSGQQESTVSISGLDANFDESLKLVREHFAKPTGVGQEDLDKLVARTLGSRADQKEQFPALFGALNMFALRGIFSPFINAPSNEDLESAKADDLLASARSLWDHKRIVTYSGSRSADEVAAAIAPAGNGGTALEDPPDHEPVLYIDARRNRVLFVHSPAAQALIGIFGPDGKLDPKQVPYHRVYNEYMSGSMGAVVFQEVREARALAYAVGTRYARGNRLGDANVMFGRLGTQADKTVEAIDVLLGLIRKMPGSEDRLAQVKENIDQSYRSNRLRYRELPGAALSWDRWGLDGDPRQWNWEQTQKMTLADVEGWAERMADKHFTITIVGDRSRIDLEALEKFGEVKELTADDLFNW